MVMNAKKDQIILYIYDELIHGRDILRNQILGEFNISLRSFRRYISTINVYLSNFYKSQEVIYDYKTRSYKLVDM